MNKSEQFIPGLFNSNSQELTPEQEKVLKPFYGVVFVKENINDGFDQAINAEVWATSEEEANNKALEGIKRRFSIDSLGDYSVKISMHERSPKDNEEPFTEANIIISEDILRREKIETGSRKQKEKQEYAIKMKKERPSRELKNNPKIPGLEK